MPGVGEVEKEGGMISGGECSGVGMERASLSP